MKKVILFVCILMSVTITMTAKRRNIIHCNWGWGGDRNGYFLENGFNAEQNPPYKDDGTATRSENYRYKLKTATIW